MNAFNINNADIPAATLNTLIELYAQNEILLEGMAMLVSLSINLPIDTVQLAQQTKMEAAREKIKAMLFELYGRKG